MNQITIAQLTIPTSITAIGVISVAFLTYMLGRRMEIHKARIDMKRKALLDALNITDAILSHRSPNSLTEKTEFTTEEVRKVYNNLAVTVKNEVILEKFRAAWGIDGGAVRMDIISDLRDLARKELGFGKRGKDINRDRAFFSTIGGSSKRVEK